MRKVKKSEMKVVPAPNGKQVMVRLDGEWVGVSRVGQDECIEDLDHVGIGETVEAGTEKVQVIE